MLDNHNDLLEIYDYLTDMTTKEIIKHNYKLKKKENRQLNIDAGINNSRFFHNYMANKKLKVSYKTNYEIDFVSVLKYCQECNTRENLYKVLYEVLAGLDADNVRTLYFMVKNKIAKK